METGPGSSEMEDVQNVVDEKPELDLETTRANVFTVLFLILDWRGLSHSSSDETLVHCR